MQELGERSDVLTLQLFLDMSRVVVVSKEFRCGKYLEHQATPLLDQISEVRHYDCELMGLHLECLLGEERLISEEFQVVDSLAVGKVSSVEIEGKFHLTLLHPIDRRTDLFGLLVFVSCNRDSSSLAKPTIEHIAEEFEHIILHRCYLRVLRR